MPELLLRSIGHAHPEHVLDNFFFDALDIGSKAHWVERTTGIRTRRTLLSQAQIQTQRYCPSSPPQGLSQLAHEAFTLAKKRLRHPFQPDLLLFGSSTPEVNAPAQSSQLAALLGCPQATAFDAQSACSSFVLHLKLAKALLHDHHQLALIVADRYTSRLDYNDKRTAILFGDGAACSFIEPWKNQDPLPHHPHGLRGLKLLGLSLLSDAHEWESVLMPVHGAFTQKGAQVQHYAIRACVALAQKLSKDLGLSTQDFDYFIGHQANLRMLEQIAQRIGLEKRHLYNIDTHGNQGSAGAPCVLSTHWDTLHPGERILITVVGAGITWGAVAFEAL